MAGVDPSESFVAAATARHPVGRHPPRRRRAPARSTTTIFDATLAELVVHFMTDAAAGAREMVRVTRPGGVVAACVWDFAGGRAPQSLFFAALGSVVTGIDDESHRVGAREGDLGGLLRDAGCTAVEETELTVEVEYPTLNPAACGAGAVLATARALGGPVLVAIAVAEGYAVFREEEVEAKSRRVRRHPRSLLLRPAAGREPPKPADVAKGAGKTAAAGCAADPSGCGDKTSRVAETAKAAAEKVTDVARSLDLTGPKAIEHIRRHAQHAREAAMRQGLERPKTLDDVKAFLDQVMKTEETRVGTWGDVGQARFYRLGDAVVVTRMNGQYVTNLDTIKGGSIVQKWAEAGK